jgi:mRNA-degrading endonuclease YafQ of YafQ-DinJ toxin-antitoxin module
MSPAFRRSLGKLSDNQFRSAKKAFVIFRQDPFDPRLRTHKIHGLSSAYKKTIYSVWIEGDLRATFFLQGSDVISVDIGTHSIYRS